MYRKILVGLDGSESAWQAFRRALELARAYDSELWALSVEELPHFAATLDEIQDEQERENAYFAGVQGEARELAEEAGVVLHTRIVAGHAAERLVALAREGGFDLIVIGHRGHLSPWHRLLGSAADRIVDQAPCDVLVERPPARHSRQRWRRPIDPEGRPVFRTILVAFDGSPSAWRALRRAVLLAREHGAALHALTVEEPLPPYAAAGQAPEHTARIERLQGEARREAAEQGVQLETTLLRGHAAQAIVEHAQRIGADLIAIGPHGHGGVLERVLGSTTDRVVDTARCSVLVVRGKAAAP